MRVDSAETQEEPSVVSSGGGMHTCITRETLSPVYTCPTCDTRTPLQTCTTCGTPTQLYACTTLEH